ncbi:MAG: hypothetical protein L0G87_11685 [Renibacterium salmoninarum]|nr:hypothetical protein [Renibacterium salmoninarum]
MQLPSEGVIIAIISALAAVVSAWININTTRKTRRSIVSTHAVAVKARVDAAATREQVTNSHATNLRDDVTGIATAIDRIGDDITRLHSLASTQAADQAAIRGDVLGIRGEISVLHQADRTLWQAINQTNHTN